MATITTKKDKAGNVTGYKVTLCVGRDETNKQIWRTCTIKRPEGLTPAKERKEVERQADAWAEAQKAEYDRTHAKADKTKITFKQFVEDHWMKDHVKTADHTPSSVEFFEYTSQMAIDYFGEKKRLKEIDTEAVKKYINFLKTTPTKTTGEPFGASSIKHFYGTLKNILRYAKRMHYIEYDPTEDLSQKEKPHRERKGIDFLEPAQAVEFLFLGIVFSGFAHVFSPFSRVSEAGHSTTPLPDTVSNPARSHTCDRRLLSCRSTRTREFDKLYLYEIL